MFRCYMLLQISVKHIQDESHLAKGKLWVEPALKWAMHFILYGIIRQYASILVTSKNSGSHAVTTWAMFKIQKNSFDWWLCGLILSNICGLSQSVMGNHKPASAIQYTGITLQVTLLTMNGSGEVSQSFRIDLWRNMAELVLVETSKARTTNSDDLFMILRG